MDGCTVAKINTIDSFKALQPVWNDLVEAGQHPNVFLTFEWLFSWWETFGSLHELYILVVSHDEQIIGVAPLMLSDQGGGGTKVQFIGTPDSDYSNFLSSRPGETTAAILDYLMDHRNDWNQIDLHQISARSSTVEHTKAFFGSNGANNIFGPGETCHSFVYELGDDKRESFALRRNKTMKWSINFFKKSGSLSLEEHKTAEGIEPWLDRMFHYHIVRWRNTLTPSKLTNERNRCFYRSVLGRLATNQQVSLLVLKHDDLPIAFQFNFCYRGSVYIYTLAHNIHFRRQSPGKIMNHLASQHYIQRGYDELDFTRGSETYKGSLTNQTFTNYQLKVYRSQVHHSLSLLYGLLKLSGPARLLARSRRLSDWKNRLSLATSNQSWRSLSMAIAKRSWRKVFHSQVVTTHRYDESVEGNFKISNEFEYSRANESSLVAIASFYGAPENSQLCTGLADRLQGGDDCFVVSVDDFIVAVIWGVTENHDSHGGGEVVLTDAFVSPACDIEIVLPSIIKYAAEYYHQNKVNVLIRSTTWAGLAPESLEQAGFVVKARKRNLRFLGVRIV